MSNKNIIQKQLEEEYINKQSSNTSNNKPHIDKGEHRFDYDNDYILLSVINRARKLKELGFEVSAIGMIKEYCNRYYPDKIEDTLKLI